MKLLSVLLVILASSPIHAQLKYWVFLKDKPEASWFRGSADVPAAEKYLIDNGILTRRAIERRLKVLPPSQVVSLSDFPLYPPYIDSLKSLGLRIDGTSRWFNAAAVISDSSQLLKLRGLLFVVATKKMETRAAMRDPVYNGPGFPEGLIKGSPQPGQPQPGDSSFYGPSLTQLELSGIPEVHALGINASGVLIGMLDAGFRYETHEALQHVDVVGEHDFIQNDSLTENQQGDAPDQDNHGTSTLSVLGGYSPGNIIGVAYGAQFLLAKTEYVPVTDFKWEEDNWVEGIEWMESRGVDVVSSSVGYDIFVDSSGVIDSSQSYFWSRGDFDGRKALASRAATRAAELGVVVVQSAGNQGNGNDTTGTLLVPADADSIITAGAVDFTGRLAGFSSTGPTSDGRIKPDLVADGVGDYVAVVPGPDTYAYESGTSFSAPMTAGVAALVLSVRPNFTPMQVIDLLKATAESVPYGTPPIVPNNYYGWGLVNAWNVVKSLGIVGSNSFSGWQDGSSVYLAVRAYSTAGIDPALSRGYYSLDGVNYTPAPVAPTDTLNQYAIAVPAPAALTKQIIFYFDFADSSGARQEVPFAGPASPFRTFGWKLDVIPGSDSYLLFNGYPNPFNSDVHISFVLRSAGSVKVDVYDVLGRKVKSLADGQMSSGFQDIVWNGTNGIGEKVGSGPYFIRVIAGGTAKVLKIMYLK